MIVLVQVLRDPRAVRSGQQPDADADASDDQGDKDNTQNDSPSFFHSAGLIDLLAHGGPDMLKALRVR